MGSHLSILRLANELLASGNYDEAEQVYLRCLAKMNQLTEPVLGITVCNLYRGKAKIALSWIVRPIRSTLAGYKAADPDPVEWAYLIISLLSLGRLKSARRRAAQFPWLRHTELDRTRWITELLSGGDASPPYAGDHDTKQRVSIHQLPKRNLVDWLASVLEMLRACGQEEAAATISRTIVNQSAGESAVPSGIGGGLGRVPAQWMKKQRYGLFGRKANLHGLDNPLLAARAVATVAEFLLGMRHQLGTVFHRMFTSVPSKNERQKFLVQIGEVLRTSNIKSVMLLGANRDNEIVETLTEACKDCEMELVVYCMDAAQGWKVLKNGPVCKPYVPIKNMSNGIDPIKIHNHLNAFDAVIVDSIDNKTMNGSVRWLYNELRAVQVIALTNIGSSLGHELFSEFLKSRTHSVVSFDDGVNNRFGIFCIRQSAND